MEICKLDITSTMRWRRGRTVPSGTCWTMEEAHSLGDGGRHCFAATRAHSRDEGPWRGGAREAPHEALVEVAESGSTKQSGLPPNNDRLARRLTRSAISLASRAVGVHR